MIKLLASMTIFDWAILAIVIIGAIIIYIGVRIPVSRSMYKKR